MRKFESIEINLGDSKTRQELADGLRVIADQIEMGAYSGIAGWSDVSWSTKLDEEPFSDEEEECQS